MHTAGPQAVLQETPGWVMKAGRFMLRPQVADIYLSGDCHIDFYAKEI